MTRDWPLTSVGPVLSSLGNDHAAASQSALGVELATEAPAADSTLKPSSHPAPAPNGSDTDQSSGGTGSLSGNATTDGETTSQAPEPKKDNGNYSTRIYNKRNKM